MGIEPMTTRSLVVALATKLLGHSSCNSGLHPLCVMIYETCRLSRGAPEQQTAKVAAVVFGGFGFNSRIAVLSRLPVVGFIPKGARAPYQREHIPHTNKSTFPIPTRAHFPYHRAHFGILEGGVF